MGLLDRRKRKIAENAAEHLEPGESIQAMVMTQTGESADELATKVAAHNARRQSAAAGDLPYAAVGKPPSTDAVVHALVATDKHVYAFQIPTLTGIGGITQKAPLASADVRLEDKKTVVFDDISYNVLFFAGKDAQALVDYVETGR